MFETLGAQFTEQLNRNKQKHTQTSGSLFNGKVSLFSERLLLKMGHSSATAHARKKGKNVVV